MKSVNIRELKMFEGKRITFLGELEGDDGMGPREGIITDVIVGDRTSEVRAVVLWDTDDFIAYVDNQQIFDHDLGTATYPLTSICNKKRFQIHNT